MKKALQRHLNLPMRRDLAQPLDAGVLHGDVRVEALGHGAGDEGGALLLKQLDQTRSFPATNPSIFGRLL